MLEGYMKYLNFVFSIHFQIIQKYPGVKLTIFNVISSFFVSIISKTWSFCFQSFSFQFRLQQYGKDKFVEDQIHVIFLIRCSNILITSSEKKLRKYEWLNVFHCDIVFLKEFKWENFLQFLKSLFDKWYNSV